MTYPVWVEMRSKVLAGGPHVGDLSVAVDDEAVRLDVLLHRLRDGLGEAGRQEDWGRGAALGQDQVTLQDGELSHQN